MQGDDIVRLGTAAGPAEAVAWQEALQEEGIPCKVVGDLLESGFLDPQSTARKSGFTAPTWSGPSPPLRRTAAPAAEDAEPDEA